MSECVVRMEMPKDCPMCPMSHWNKQDEFTGCKVAPGKLYEMLRSKEYRDSNTRPNWCPIICQLPEGHGRLVDADALLRDIEKYHASDGKFQHWLELQPTIVPAERRTNDGAN